MARGTVRIDEARCKGCELCMLACPKEVIEMASDRLNAKGYRPAQLVDPNEQCTGCALCAVVCPDVCIMVFREPAARRRGSERPAMAVA